MKREIARGLFLLASLAIATAAVAAWQPPVMQVLSNAQAGAQCPIPRVAKVAIDAEPDHDLLLFMYGMKQGLRP
ncbi:hypothetical protein NTD86_18260 [Pseudomonas sp. 7P_10.2_Bac1]|uniref:hypothetical protein n=1 Tax=Pseudomonas sp. 7P_10.2_Bac1 TaxID=2971614 RepID=UPI0021C897E1|nr:hypothetical protein [Pseudomonas sp. 7P_10.2_Bac1]MCU1728930.1 hypothetical protein [Pseudomonas sp. 7P_10.2_Bac1]